MDTSLRKTHKIRINGDDVNLVEDAPDLISYESICKAAGFSKDRVVSVMYTVPGRMSGALWKGRMGPIKDGAEYDACITNNA